MTPDLRVEANIYADAGVFCRFEETLGINGLLELLKFFDTRLNIVTDVERELKGLSYGPFPALALMKLTDLKNELLRVPATQLPPNLAVQVAQIAASWPGAGTSPRKNHGEVATVLMAQSLGASTVIDDGAGRKFAHRRGVHVWTTRDVVVALVADGFLPQPDGRAVWDCVYRHDRGAPAYEAALRSYKGI